MPDRKSRITRDILTHLCLAAAFAFFIYQNSASINYVFLFVAGSILIDLDHLIDYFIFYKDKFCLQDFFIGRFLKSGKVYLFFHSWEITIFLLILSFAFNLRGLSVFSFGLAVHLLIDNFQRKNRFFCLLVYRGIKNFDAKVLLPEDNDFITDLAKNRQY